LFGFLVVPFWLFFVMNDYHAGTRAFDRLLAPWLRNDVWAVLRIIDRIFSKYIRGQLLLGVIIGIASYVGLTILKFAGVGGIQYELLLALIAGVTELVPLIGPVIGAIPAVILGFSDSWQSGLAILALYIGIQQLENSFLVPRVQGQSIEIHPAILSAALVALSQFGFIWLVLAAPLVAIIRDLFRYLYGRFGDPPEPAGVIPGDDAP
jgi:predicted PurR-regulated permease PerM